MHCQSRENCASEGHVLARPAQGRVDGVPQIVGAEPRGAGDVELLVRLRDERRALVDVHARDVVGGGVERRVDYPLLLSGALYVG